MGQDFCEKAFQSIGDVALQMGFYSLPLCPQRSLGLFWTKENKNQLKLFAHQPCLAQTQKGGKPPVKRETKACLSFCCQTGKTLQLRSDWSVVPFEVDCEGSLATRATNTKKIHGNITWFANTLVLANHSLVSHERRDFRLFFCLCLLFSL